MKKFSCYLLVLISFIFISANSSGNNAVKDSIKKSIKISIKESKAEKDTSRADINLSDAVVKKLSDQEIIDIIKYQDKLTFTRKMAALKYDEPPVPILIVIFGSFVLMMLIPYYFNMRKTRSLHLTMNNLIEKGHDIPKELIFPLKRRTVRSDFHKGIILMTLGVSLCLVLFLTKCENNYWTIGFIPILVGIGYMISFKFNNSGNSKTENR